MAVIFTRVSDAMDDWSDEASGLHGQVAAFEPSIDAGPDAVTIWAARLTDSSMSAQSAVSKRQAVFNLLLALGAR